MRKCIQFLISSLLFTVVDLYAQEKPLQLNAKGTISYPNEPTICISKTDGSKVTAAANINYHFHSTDEPDVWIEKRLVSGHGVWGDPVLHAAGSGKIYICHLSYTPGKVAHYGFIDRIVVQYSDDDGQHFSDGVGVGMNDGKVQDKPWLSSDDYSDKFRDQVYLTWTEFDRYDSKKKKHKSRIQFSLSKDQAQTWSDAMTISDNTGSSFDDDDALEGATTAVDRDGNIYCVWAGLNRLYFDKSTDGGKTWGKDKVIGEQKAGWVIDIPHVYRCNGMPFLMIDNSEGPHKGRLYVVYGDTIFGDADVFMIYSDDMGENWSSPNRINQDDKSNGKSQFLPNMAVDQSNGHLYAVFQDRRNCPYNVFSHTYLAKSDDGGASWMEKRLTSSVSPPHGEGVFSGDYNDIDASNGQVYAIWTEFNKTSKVVTVQLWDDEIAAYQTEETPRVFCHLHKEKGVKIAYFHWTDSTSFTINVVKRRFLRKDEVVVDQTFTPNDSYLNSDGTYAVAVPLPPRKKISILLLKEVEGASIIEYPKFK
jgi:hypothetical protein